MKTLHGRSAFTLIEVLIVVTIVAILAGVTIKQFGSTVRDARQSALMVDLNKMRTLIELYKTDHSASAPTGANNLEQLISSTNAQGLIGPPGTAYPHGPYMVGSIPENPFSRSRKVRLFTGSGKPTASGAADAGWIYNPTTGAIWCDDPAYISY